MALTWTRARTGATAGAGTDQLVQIKLATFEPAEATTIRWTKIQWALDLFAVDTDGTLNTASPVTIGLSLYEDDDDEPVSPDEGPKTDPTFPWLWWEGQTFDNAYGLATGPGTNGALLARGEFIRKAPFLLDPLFAFHTMYLTIEIEDGGEKWSSFAGIAWSQFLHAPTVG